MSRRFITAVVAYLVALAGFRPPAQAARARGAFAHALPARLAALVAASMILSTGLAVAPVSAVGPVRMAPAGLPSTATAGVQTAGRSPAKWTVMVYMAADNNLEPDTIINLMEMAAVGSSPDVNIVVQLTRPANYSGFYGAWGGTRRFLITKSDGNASTGDFQFSPSRFATFLNAVGPKTGLSPDQITQVLSSSPANQEGFALHSTFPTIDPGTPLMPLQLANVQDLGTAVNSADGVTLAGFGTWAVNAYPADHYGLVMWDHGAGWSAIANDDVLGKNGMSIPAMTGALATITAATGRKLDFIGFDACLMAELQVADAVQPYAAWDIAAEELVPGLGWDYTPPLAALEANPSMTGRDFGHAVVDAFNTLYSGTRKASAQSFDLGVLDLSKVDGVVSAVASFDTAVGKAKGHDLKVVATARANAQAFASVGKSSDLATTVSSVDLGDFERIVGNLSQDAGVKLASTKVREAVGQLVVYHRASASLPQSNGLSVFFPADANTFTAADGDRYRTEFAALLPRWQDFLDTYYGAAAAAGGTPLLQITSVSTKSRPGSIYDTPVISFNLTGRNTVSVQATVLYQLNPTTLVALDQFPIVSMMTAPDGSQVSQYPDGKSVNDFYWNTRIPSLQDATGSLKVLMTTNAGDQQHGYISGEFTDVVTGTQSLGTLAINLATMQSSGFWATADANGNAQLAAQLTPTAGDAFEPIYTTIALSDGSAQRVLSGRKFVFGNGPLTVATQPGPDGTYTMILSATNAAGTAALAQATLRVRNGGLNPSLQGFKVLGTGMSFLYPSAWTDVQSYTRGDGLDVLYVSDVSGNDVITVTDYPTRRSLASAQAATIADLKGIRGVVIGRWTGTSVGTNRATKLSYHYRDTTGATIYGTAVAVYVASNRQGYELTIEVPHSQVMAAKSIFAGVLKTAKFFTPV
jgi:hypothetical protein